MSIAELFINRRVMTTLVMLALLVFGVIAYQKLPVSDLPSVDFPTITVNAALPGASPDTMASAVAKPLESQFSTIAGLEEMSSSNTNGNTRITLQFDFSRDIDAAAQDVQAMIAKAARDLPVGMPSPPSYQKVNPADQPVLFLALSSATMKISDVDEYAETLIAPQISMVSGVATVNIFGAQKYAVRIQLDPRTLASRQIGIDEVTTAVENANVNLPTGTLYGSKQAFTVQANGQLTKAEQYRPLIVAYRNGSPVRLDELGQVLASVENDKTASWFMTNHQLTRAIILAIQRQPGTNTVEVVNRIRQLFPQFRQRMPAAVEMEVLSDHSISIRNSIQDVKVTLYLALALVVLVIFLFLRNVSATVIPSLALPMSIVATFAVMYFLGYSLDNLSMMALTLSVGFVVDDAIVMLENIVRHMERGEPAAEAAVTGSREISFTIVSMTLSLAAVFIPVLFMGGILGRLLHEFAVTIGVAILVSGFVSLSLTPMLCSIFLRPPRELRHGRLYAAFEAMFDNMLRIYEWSLQHVIRYRAVTLAVLAVVMAAVIYLFILIPKGFLPSEDTGRISASTQAAQGISFDDMIRHQLAVANLLKDNPYIDNFFTSVGSGAGNTGNMFIQLIPRQNRPSVDELIQKSRPELATIPGVQVFLQNPPPIRIGGQVTNAQYQYTLQSADTNLLYEYAPKLEEKIRGVPGLQDVSSDLQLKNPQLNVNIDRDRAATLGVTAQQIEQALNTAYGSPEISTIYQPTNAYKVEIELLPRFQADPSALSLLYIRSASGQLVPLNEVASVSSGFGPLTVNHMGQLPSATISFNLKPGTSLGDAVSAVGRVAGETLPSGITAGFQGAAQAFESSLQGLGLLLVMTVVVIYVVLGILYESFIHPITILSGLPAAGFGALLTLLLFHMELDLYAFVGIIMLVGIVKKNAIMMIDFALDLERNEDIPAAEAIYQGALIRFRPIMMTTIAALAGTFPIALGLGAGGESRRPLGLAVVGGLLFSQVLTLYITPVVYTYMESARNWFRKTPRPAREQHHLPLGAD